MTKEEADAHLYTAIHAHAVAYELAKPDEMLSEYAVIAHWQKQVSDGRSRYTTHFHTPTVPNHVAMGLFAVGQNLACNEDDEEP